MMRKYGKNSFIIILLERLICDNSQTMSMKNHNLGVRSEFLKISKVRENFWMRRLQTVSSECTNSPPVPYTGLNSATTTIPSSKLLQIGIETNVKHTKPTHIPYSIHENSSDCHTLGFSFNIKPKQNQGRTYISHDTPKAVEALERRFLTLQKTPTFTELREMLQSYNLERLQEFLFYAFSGDQNRTEELSNTITFLQLYLTNRFPDRRLSRPDNRSMIIVPYVDEGIDELKIPNILASLASEHIPPEVLRAYGPPLTVFKNGGTLAQDLIKSRASTTDTTEENILKYRRDCICHRACLQKYLSKSQFCGEELHVLTVDPSVLGNDELDAYMTLGTKFRPCGVSDTTHEEGLASYIYEQLERYVQKMQHLTNLDQKVFKNFLTEARLKLDSIFEDYEPNFSSKGLSDLANTHLTRAQKRLHFTYLDKSPNTFVFVCKYAMAHSLSTFVQSQPDTFLRLNKEDAALVLAKVNTFVISTKVVVYKKEHKQTANSYQSKPTKKHPNKPNDFAYLYLAPKLNPKGYKFRPISGGRFVPTTALSCSVTAALKLIQNSADNMHRQLFAAALGYIPPHGCQILTGCDQLTALIRHLNHLVATQTIDIKNLKFATNDFTSMYTKLPQETMIKQMTELISYTFRKSDTFGKGKFMRVPKFHCSKTESAEWAKSPNTPKSGEDTHVTVDENTLISWVVFLINNSYFQVGGNLYHQTNGLPMGENYAVLVANLVCFTFEMAYAQRLYEHLKLSKENLEKSNDQSPDWPLLCSKKAKILQILWWMALSKRYIDDRFEVLVDDLNMLEYMYDERERDFNGSYGSDGIYPYYMLHSNGTAVVCPLEVKTVCPPATQAHCLDLTVWIAKDRIFTKIYDKRLGNPIFAKTLTFPHIESKLPESTKYGVLYPQLIRFSDRCSRMRDFINAACELTIYMAHNGYEPKKLWRSILRFGNLRWPQILGHWKFAKSKIRGRLLDAKLGF